MEGQAGRDWPGPADPSRVPGALPHDLRHEAELGVRREGLALPQRPSRQQPLLPAGVVLGTVPALVLPGGSQGSVGGDVSWRSTPLSPSTFPPTHFAGLKDGDHVALAEGQLPGFGARVLTLGDALGARGPAPLGGSGESGKRVMREMVEVGVGPKRERKTVLRQRPRTDHRRKEMGVGGAQSTQ